MNSPMLTLGLWDSTDINILSADEVRNSSFAALKQTAEDNNDPMKQKDLMYISFVLCHEGPNKNGDYFYKEELEACYASPIHKAYDWEHDSPIIGVITDSQLIVPDEEDEDQRLSIVCAAVVWKYMFAEYAKLIAKYALSGDLRNSMECWFDDYEYIIGEYGTEQQIFSRADRPELAKFVGKTVGGKPVYRGLKGILFGGCGCVSNPADVDAIFKSVASKRNPLQLFDIFPETEEVLSVPTEEEIKAMEDAKAEIVGIDNLEVVNIEDTIPEVVEAEIVEPVVEPVEEVIQEVVAEIIDVVVEPEQVTDIPEVVTPEGVIAAYDVNKLIDERIKSSEFYGLFYVIEEVAYSILNDSKIGTDDKPAAFAEQLQIFSDRVSSVFPDIVKQYMDKGWASTSAATKKTLEDQVAELTTSLDALQKEYSDYKASIDADNAVKEKDTLCAKRIKDLADSGLKMDEKMAMSVKEQIQDMPEEKFLEYKSFLISVRYAGVEIPITGEEVISEVVIEAEVAPVVAEVVEKTVAVMNFESDGKSNLLELINDIGRKLVSKK